MKQTVTIQLNLSEIIYDIQNKTFLTGRSAHTESNHSHIANMQANDDEENSSQILRSVSMASALLQNRLSEYIDGENTSADNNLIEGSGSLTFKLVMPSNFNDSVTTVIAQAAHQFVVATAIRDWFAITAKDETYDYSSVAEASLKIIEEALCKRTRPSRP